jgi:hypothetical protein
MLRNKDLMAFLPVPGVGPPFVAISLSSPALPLEAGTGFPAANWVIFAWLANCVCDGGHGANVMKKD